jgi:hypothetical protein
LNVLLESSEGMSRPELMDLHRSSNNFRGTSTILEILDKIFVGKLHL